jgi:hypothetical protein
MLVDPVRISLGSFDQLACGAGVVPRERFEFSRIARLKATIRRKKPWRKSYWPLSSHSQCPPLRSPKGVLLVEVLLVEVRVAAQVAVLGQVVQAPPGAARRVQAPTAL